jgi:hypothetical protein
MVNEDATTVIATPVRTKMRVYGTLSLVDRTAAKKAISRNAATMGSMLGVRSFTYLFPATLFEACFLILRSP